MKFSRKNDHTCFELCEMQSRIFAKSVDDKIPSNVFIRSYMLSTAVRYVDELQIDSVETDEVFLYDFIQEKIATRKGTIFSHSEMKWIGYIYRAMSYMLNVSSKELFKKIPPNYLKKVFEPYHTFDVVRAIEEICEDTGYVKKTREELFKILYKNW